MNNPTRPRGEHGAVAVIMAAGLTAILVAGAFVLDFGIARVDRTSNKLTADAAALAGLGSLSDQDDTRRPWRAVCTAVSYLKANDDDLTSGSSESWRRGNGTTVSAPCSTPSVYDSLCVPDGENTSHASWARYDATSADGRVVVTISSGYQTPDPAFPEDAAAASDSGSATEGGCDQLAVIITESRSPGLGSLAVDGDIVTRIRSVGRAVPNQLSEHVPALILLERNACDALTVGSNVSFIEVFGSGSAPGSIHADSLGNGSNCTSDATVIDGKFSKHIWAHAAASGSPRRPGSITVVASSGAPGAVPARATDGAANTCAETVTATCAAATGRGIVGRRPADLRYLTGVRTALAAAAPLYNATATPSGYVLQGGDCTFNSSDTDNATTSPVFVNCPNGATFKDRVFTFANAPSVVFNGPVEIQSGSGSGLAAPKATRLYVRGRTTAGANTGLVVKKGLRLNNVSGDTACPGLTAQPRAQLVVGYGPLSGEASAAFRLCHTTALLAGNSAAACPVPATIGTAPTTNACTGSLNLSGGASVDWTAPNLITTRSATNTETNTLLEDLAFWTETSAASGMGGGGLVSLAGVFVAPNAPFSLGGGSDSASRQDAQFMARSLQVTGNATVRMTPDPRDSIKISAAPLTGLVR